jgi:uncharacterized protein YbjT (DUF2867 family)
MVVTTTTPTVNIAVVGINGFLGKPVIQGLLSEPFVSKINTPIKLVTTNPDKRPIESSKVEYIDSKKVSYTEAFKGVDVVINLGNVPAFPAQDVLDAVIANKVKLYIPSQFGCDVNIVDVDFPGLLTAKSEHSAAARKAGVKTVDILTAFFYDGETFIGFDIPFAKVDENNNIEIVGDENTKVNPTHFKDIGLATAAIATSSDYSKLPDDIRIYSAEITIGDLLTKYEKKHGVKLNRKYTDAQEFFKTLKEKHAQNGPDFSNFLGYLVAVLNAGEGKGLIWEKENERELVNPNESLFKWFKFEI